ncbi:MAG: radical SAM protein [Bacteroidales bacterium]|nr:radical SAM protein [Bacteroidales bacterium]
MIKLLSIDLSNFCSKKCSFCYNKSSVVGQTLWKTDEVISFAKSCVENGIEAVSLGGGEPFEYKGVFEIIAALQPLVYLSVTTNGLMLQDEKFFEKVIETPPDKIHITIHFPDNEKEVSRVIKTLEKLSKTNITPGVNLLVNSNKTDVCQQVYKKLLTFLTPKQIILIPQRFSDTPTPKQLAAIAGGKPFQSPSCLLKCTPPQDFCSVSWDKKVNFCSYAGGKKPLQTLDYHGLMAALANVEFKQCC